MRYLIVIEPTGTGYSAYSPDVLGCVATGRPREEVECNIREAIEFHLEGMQADGDPIPQPTCTALTVEVAA